MLSVGGSQKRLEALSRGVVAFAGGLAHRGIEPSLLFAYVIFFNETIGAVCLMLGLFTRVIAAIIAVEFAVITFVAHFPNGFSFSSPGGGWEYPLMWGLIIFAMVRTRLIACSAKRSEAISRATTTYVAVEIRRAGGHICRQRPDLIPAHRPADGAR